MAKLGFANKILYTSKDLIAGLANISAKIIKPNGSVIGPFVLTEMTEPGFEGNYFFTFSTSLSDPEGDYIGSIISPDESHKTNFKVSIYADSSGGGGTIAVSSDEQPLVGIVEDITVIGILEDAELMSGDLSDSDISGEIEDNKTISGELSLVDLSGEIEDIIK